MGDESVGTGLSAPTSTGCLTVGPDGFTYAADAPYAPAHRYLDTYLALCLAETGANQRARLADRLGRQAASLAITPDVPRIEILCAALERFDWAGANGLTSRGHEWSALGYALARMIWGLCEDKAFLLADDASIKDPAIVRQIRPAAR